MGAPTTRWAQRIILLEHTMPGLEGYPVVLEMDVRWGDMDAFAHVNNTVYFRYFESARIAYFERMGMLDGGPIGPILGATSARFRAPLTHPDRVQVGTRVTEVGEDRFVMEYAVYSQSQEKLAATGDGRVVVFDYKAGKKTTMPEAWRSAIAELEAD